MVDLFVYLPSDAICRLISSLSRCSRQCTDRTSSWQTIGSENERYVEEAAPCSHYRSYWWPVDIYHITWNVPSSRDVQERLIQLEENSEKMMHSRLKEYRRYWFLTVACRLRNSSCWLERSMESKIATNLYYARSMPINRWTTFSLKSIPTPRRKLVR